MHGQAMVNTKLTAADCHPNQPDRIEFDMLQDVEDAGKKYFNIHHVGSSKSVIGNKLHVISTVGQTQPLYTMHIYSYLKYHCWQFPPEL